MIVLPRPRLGRRRGGPGPRLPHPRRPRRRHLRRAGAAPGRERAARSPARLSWEEAAALPLAGLTAYRALVSRARIRPGETVLVLGIGGGVATIATMLARAAGCRVIVTSSSQEKIDRARDLGADGGVLYTEDDWVGAVRELTGGRGVDVVVDSVGRDVGGQHRLRAAGRPRGGLRRHRRRQGGADGARRSPRARSPCSAPRWAARATSRACSPPSTPAAGRR